MIAALREGYKSITNFRRIFIPSINDVSSPGFHDEWNDLLLHGKKHFCVEAFRESGKSQIVIRGHTLYRLVYPSREYDYILLILANQRSASKKLKELADEYLTNPVFSSNLIRIREQSEKAFDVEVYDIAGNPINVRIEAYGKGSAIRGLSYRDKRPALVVADDLQSTDDAMSETICEKDWEWFLSDVMFLGQNTRIFLIGNNLGERCLIERVIANAEQLGFEWKRLAIIDGEGKSVWPEKYTLEYIDKEREAYSQMGTLDVWFRERMCVAISPESQRFKPDMLQKRYDPKNFKTKDLSIYITVDLAISQKLTADYTVILVCGVNEENHWFLLDCIYGRFDPTTTMDKIFEAVSKWKPIKVGIESVAYQAALEVFLIKEMPKRNIFFSIQPLKAQTKKELRIEALQPRFTAGTIWLPEQGTDQYSKVPWLTEFEAELLSFPKGGHDDIIDALAYVEQVAIAPSGTWGKVKSDDLPIAGAL